MLTWLHFGDLHASQEDGWRSVHDLEAMIADANRRLSWAVDFAYLPGDNANHGAPEQYARIRAALEELDLRWFAIPGDHDFEPGSLRAFYDGLGVPPLPLAVTLKGVRCLFLDIVSAGEGGPDFRLGAQQRVWLKEQLASARHDGQCTAVFMHAFPGDLADDAEEIGHLFAREDVAGVDTGHTHYNELLNDNRVIYTATRSTGQVEEGPVGFSLQALDGSAVSWRFKALDRPWPFVLITSPCDRRLITDPRARDQVPGESFPVRAKVFGGPASVSLQVDDRPPASMARTGEADVWTGTVSGLDDGLRTITVEAAGEDGSRDQDAISVQVSWKAPASRPDLKPKPGSDENTIGPWPEHGLRGTQLGPNKNGRKW